MLHNKMVLIPAGRFDMGDHLDNIHDAVPVHTVELDAFYMDIHQVTVGQFRQFVEESGYNYSRNSWNNVAKYSLADDHPIVLVNWYDATAYAKWAGKRLPTEAEWEYAARGGLVGKRYPWGDEITRDDANYLGTGSTARVGSYAANGYGLYDMAGNAWEWCADWYGEDYYSNSPLKNPTGPETGQYRAVRGGTWNNLMSYVRVATRKECDPSFIYRNFGFRCAAGVSAQ